VFLEVAVALVVPRDVLYVVVVWYAVVVLKDVLVSVSVSNVVVVL
tara:strand:+ start:1754 stop:1888 length:135 start_codon:yes stop_codon:yes gene_type:complete